MIAEMFSHDQGMEDFTKTTTNFGFFGNDGVCLFKYFIQQNDPQRTFVWSTLVLIFACIVVITVCNIIIGTLPVRSSNSISTRNDDQARKRMNRTNRMISIIVTTYFLCWLPFIVICMLHYIEILDATPWYSTFSMVILPINSIINPLLYNDVVRKYVWNLLLRSNTAISRLDTSLTSFINASLNHRAAGVKIDAGNSIINQLNK
jgi:hypothetical protein